MRLDQAELSRWGARIGETITAPAFVGLSGPLGAGKSVLARAIGTGAGVEAPMPSPTFTLLQAYTASGGRRVVHLDLYRIASPHELWELGWAQLPSDEDIVLLEWPERAGAHLPENHWLIELSLPEGEPLLRDVEVTRVGSPPELAAFPLSLSGR
ncbi:MAG TPA: tRNA (adenosine(37)-N6)-threonylcarbamoyltransferase complex ATPase subunit type 1 TsaE [Candidatus Limnocylindrales bacterium]|nr:tRNA (adenosine(37)-N6)-threonylcarbamoyltransferase complex ATPase subunit type 1 TsaE [Candidatus Limnocylindrales bacterium]